MKCIGLALLFGSVNALNNPCIDTHLIKAYKCDPKNPGQQWDLTNGQIVQRSTRECIGVEGFGTDNSSPLILQPCQSDAAAGKRNQAWIYDATTGHFNSTGWHGTRVESCR